MMVSSVTAMLDFGIEAVWRAVLDVENYPRWRSDLRRVEKIDAAHFVEYDRAGMATRFAVTRVEALARWEFDLENANLVGRWTGEFSPRGARTQIVFTERVALKRPMPRLLVKWFLRRQQARFVRDLRRALEKSG